AHDSQRAAGQFQRTSCVRSRSIPLAGFLIALINPTLLDLSSLLRQNPLKRRANRPPSSVITKVARLTAIAVIYVLYFRFTGMMTESGEAHEPASLTAYITAHATARLPP
ncbi:MAG: hypothetical protein P4L83_01935, partial [Nevskia sp.]|nr:hypothetical protein [Nevskia sp.]